MPLVRALVIAVTVLLVANRTRWKWSTTMVAPGSCSATARREAALVYRDELDSEQPLIACQVAEAGVPPAH